MILITGPQRTPDEQGALAEAAGFHGALTVTSPGVSWPDVTQMMALPGWRECPSAVADLLIADALDIPVWEIRTGG